MKILAFDLAYNKAGWALMEEPKKGKKLKLLKKDLIIIDSKAKLDLPQKLIFMYKALLKVIKDTKPDVIGLEDTYSGSNRDVTAKLNNAKGMALILIYNATKGCPICATAATIRSCIGLKTKEDVFGYYSKMYNIPDDFKKWNDVTDAIAVAYYCYYIRNNLCVEKKKKK